MRRRARVLILTLTTATAALPATPAAYGQPPESTSETIATVVEQYRQAAHVPGVAVAVTQGDRVLLARGFGHIADGQEVTGETVMATASVSKSFTSLAVLQLAEQGRVDLDQPVVHHLPEFVTADPRSSRITARQLLDQTSGLTDASVPQFSRTQPRSVRDSVADFANAELATPPGTTWAYYNPNYQIAARLVEVVSGQPFDRYLDEHVFTPLAMHNSRTIGTDADLPPTAHGFLKLLGHPIPASEPSTFGAGSGGVLSTADDMASWLIMQNGGAAPGTSAVVSPESLREMHSPSPASGNYALGWSVGHTPSGAPLLSHGGDLFTSTAYQALLPASGHGIAVMANTGTAHGDASAIGERLVGLLDGAAAGPDPVQPVAIDGVFLGLAALAPVLGTIGVVRARRWATTHTTARALLGMLLLGAPLLVLLLVPTIVTALYRGRDVTWAQAFYLYPSFMIFSLALTIAATSVGLMRLVWTTLNASADGHR